MIKYIPFKINYPIKIFENKEINFTNNIERESFFERNIYYNLHQNKKNPYFKKRAEDFYQTGKITLKEISKKHPNLKIHNLSLFGSRLFSGHPRDYDFLAITSKDEFLYENFTINLNKRKNINIGVSIKGIENFKNGLKENSSFNVKNPNGIIDRTASMLYRRHLPIIGKEFIKNEDIFQLNLHAQTSDILQNTYNLFYTKNQNKNLNDLYRAKKIFSRMYQASTYLENIKYSKEHIELRKKIYQGFNNISLLEAKKVFNEVNNAHKKSLENEVI